MAHEDVDLETLLRRELSIEPSVEFLPRVRERIAATPAPRRWAWWWVAPPLAAAATLTLAVSLNRDVPPPARPAAPMVPAVAIPRPTVHAQRPTPNEPRRPTTNDQPPTASEAPLVIVDEHQRDAVLAFIRLAQSGRVTEDVFKTTTPAPVEVAEPTAIEVSPIVVGGVLPSDERN